MAQTWQDATRTEFRGDGHGLAQKEILLFRSKCGQKWSCSTWIAIQSSSRNDCEWKTSMSLWWSMSVRGTSNASHLWESWARQTQERVSKVLNSLHLTSTDWKIFSHQSTQKQKTLKSVFMESIVEFMEWLNWMPSLDMFSSVGLLKRLESLFSLSRFANLNKIADWPLGTRCKQAIHDSCTVGNI